MTRMKVKKLDLKVLKNYYLFIVAYWGTMSVQSSLSVIEVTESGKVLADFLNKFTHTFFSPNFVDILCSLGLYFVAKYVFEKRPQICKSGVIVSCIFSFFYLVTFSYRDYNNISAVFGNKYQVILSIFTFVGFAAIFYLIFMLICIAFESEDNEIVHRAKGRKVFLLNFISIFVCRMFWILMNYPGSIAGDTIGQLYEWFAKEIDSHHPPLSTFLFGKLVDIGEIFVDRNFGMFLYLFLQAIVGSLIMAYCVYIIYKMGVNKKICAFTWAFWALTPEFGAYAQWLQKDMLYSLVVLWYTILLIWVLYKKNSRLTSKNKKDYVLEIKDIVLLSVVGLLCCLLRKNGIFCVIPTCVALIFYFGKKEFKKTISMTVGVLIAHLIITSGIYPMLGIEDGSLREALVVPMQQTARYLREHQDEVTDEEWEDLTELSVNIHLFPDMYDPVDADIIKSICNYEFRHLGTYFKCWFKMGLKHPGTYVAAFINGNYGYWAPANLNNAPELTNEFSEYMLEQGFYHDQDYWQVQILQNIVYANITFPFLRYLLMPGFYTWLMVICIAILLKNKKKKEIIVFIPAIMTFVVCIASPLCNGLRYIMPLCLSIPILIAYTKIALNKK